MHKLVRCCADNCLIDPLPRLARGVEKQRGKHTVDCDALVPLFRPSVALKVGADRARRLAIRLQSLNDKYEELVRCVDFDAVANDDHQPFFPALCGARLHLPLKRKETT